LLNCEYVDERQCNAIHDSAPKLQIAIGRNDRPGDTRHPASLGAATSTRHDAADWNNPRKIAGNSTITQKLSVGRRRLLRR
jgi:hypothetical protein